MAATLVGLGTTVWTVATTEPAKLPVVDPLTVATAAVKERPNRIGSWTSLSSALIARGDPPAEAAVWLGDQDPAWVSQQGADAMLWYSISHELALTTERISPDFSRPESVAARKKAIDLLISLSHAHPERMRYWHWNSLGWAWARSGQYRFAQGALERAENAIFALPDDEPPSEIVEALFRLLSCWGPNGMGDHAQQIALLHRAEGLIDQHGEAPRDNFSYVWLAQNFFNLDDPEDGAKTLDRAKALYQLADPSADLRENWRRLADAFMARRRNADALAAVESLADQLDRFGEGALRDRLTWNATGWTFALLEAPDRAQDCWRRWLANQQKLVASGAPSSGKLYDLACGLALTNDPDGALDALDRAVKAGWTDATHMEGDRDLMALRDRDRFQAILDSLHAQRSKRASRPASPTRSLQRRP